MIPDLFVIRLAIGQQCCQATREGITLTTRALQTTLALGDKRVVAVGDVVLGALLNNRDTTKSLGQLGAQLSRITLVNINALGLGQTSKLNDVRCEDALLAALNKLRARLSKEQTVGVQHKRDPLLPRLLNHFRARLLHQLVAAETWPDHDDVQPREHADDFGGYAVCAFRLCDVLLLSHDRVHHQVRAVGLDDGGGAGLADDVRLEMSAAALVKRKRRGLTMSQPSFAEAMAEK